MSRFADKVTVLRVALGYAEHAAPKLHDEARHALDVIVAALDEYEERGGPAPVVARLARAESDYDAARGQVPQRATSAATDDEPEGPTMHVRTCVECKKPIPPHRLGSATLHCSWECYVAPLNPPKVPNK